MTDQPKHIKPDQIWRDPDGTVLYVTAVSYRPPYVSVDQADQDADGRWRPVDGTRREVPEEWLRAECTYLPPPPPPVDPRVARLAELVDALVADYETTTGQPPASADDIRAALAEVAAIPAQERRRRALAVIQDRRNR